MKNCTKCGGERMADEKHSWCRKCLADTERQRRQAKGDDIRKRDRERRDQNPLKYIWRDMIRRCSDSRRSDYVHYGARGISVSALWLGDDGFRRFVEHIGPRPSPRHSVDRINTSGNYEPGNVRWATQKEQVRNSRHIRLITVNGVTMCLTDWAAKLGAPARLVSQRIDMLGWSEREAVTTPAGVRRTA
jgi:hypothetical protein